ncbi:hypothetical protein [uncultured Methanomethylovorans sp.]|uniref:hypothetical protein n=1 Tax=uncultured Methanomethylovorans sp. TaxID=183759 RepID=UPI002AA8D426|nr:hypothetical protein [uncultured Methanomethylovorans sp.]
MSFSKRFQDTNERLRRLKNSFPFFKLYLYSKEKKYPYDVPYIAIDILTLLIEEGTLRGHSLPMERIEEHIEQILAEIYPSHEYNTKEVTRLVLELLETDRNGSTYLFEHVNPIGKEPSHYNVSLIRYNISTKGYDMTDDGLDFMISTKELPEESRISIGLILFKKQIEKGSFASALNTIQELNLNVMRKKELKQELLKKMLYRGTGIVESCSKYTKEVYDQLNEEEELFEEVRKSLHAIIKYQDGSEVTRGSGLNLSKEDLDVLNKIDPELNHGYGLHSGLLKDFTSFSEEADKIMKSRIKSCFNMKWRFRETLESNVRMNRANDAHIIGMQPLFLPRVPQHFSIFKIFEPQIVSRKKETIEETQTKNEWSKSKLLDDMVKERQRNNFRIYGYCLLDILVQRNGESDLQTYLKHIDGTLGTDALYNIDLIPFLLELNNRSQDSDPKDNNNLFQTHFYLQDYENIENEDDEIAGTSLLWACKEHGIGKVVLTITSKPESHIKICENKDIHISDMNFAMM